MSITLKQLPATKDAPHHEMRFLESLGYLHVLGG